MIQISLCDLSVVREIIIENIEEILHAQYTPLVVRYNLNKSKKKRGK